MFYDFLFMCYTNSFNNDWQDKMMDKCKCGFKFSGPGEFRNCEAFIYNGQSGVICPKCNQHYLSGCPVEFIEQDDFLESKND